MTGDEMELLSGEVFNNFPIGLTCLNCLKWGVQKCVCCREKPPYVAYEIVSSWENKMKIPKEMHLLIASMSYLFVFAVIQTANANETAIKNFTGLDMIAARCIVSTKRNFATDICETLAENTKNIAAVNGIEFNFRVLNLMAKNKCYLQVIFKPILYL